MDYGESQGALTRGACTHHRRAGELGQAPLSKHLFSLSSCFHIQFKSGLLSPAQFQETWRGLPPVTFVNTGLVSSFSQLILSMASLHTEYIIQGTGLPTI